MFANCQAGGLDLALPDVCLTPPLPIPIAYPNIGLGLLALPNILHILFGGVPAHNLLTIIPVTFGDAPGVCGGVASGTVAAISRHITGSGKVLLAGAPATRLTDLTQQNLTNICGARVLPSACPIVIMS
ncbi:DUF4150 domain-containing protein [Enterobacteriaceae bacterium 4M9]|nr:DUF4150 domain-containing protein [Enterobacteriaceae bacterium 4M9]